MKIAAPFFFFVLFATAPAMSAPRADYTFKVWDRFFAYSSKTDKAFGQDHWLYFEQTYAPSSTLSAKAQFFGYFGNSKSNLIQSSDRMDEKNQVGEIWPADLYVQWNLRSSMLRAGYQQISWQEGFASSYTNFINPRDNRASIFDANDQIFRSSPMVNFVTSGEHLSSQIVYVPFSQIDVRAPASRWPARASVVPLPGQTVELANNYDGKQSLRVSHEVGARLTWAGSGLDASIFAANLKDRQGYFSLSPQSSFANIVLNPEQDYITPIGFTTSFGISDFVARFELMRASRRFNTLVGTTLATVDVGESAATIAIDSPGGEHFTFSLQHSTSILDQESVGLLRKKIEGISFGSFAYAFPREKSLRVSLMYLHADQTIGTKIAFRRPLIKSAEIEFAFEGFAGPSGSQGAAVRDLNRFLTQLNYTL